MKLKLILLGLLISFTLLGQKSSTEKYDVYQKLDYLSRMLLKPYMGENRDLSATSRAKKDYKNNLKKYETLFALDYSAEAFPIVEILIKSKEKRLVNQDLIFNINQIKLGKEFLISGRIYLNNLHKLLNERGVKKIEVSRKITGELDESAKLINANKVWEGNINGANIINGEGVFVGILEPNMLRYTHNSFLNDSGNSRIHHIWDLSTNIDCGAPFDCFSNLENFDIHATHVSGIAIGSNVELEVDGFFNDEKVQGIAPSSNILFARINGSTSLITAINNMLDYVDGAPLVINMSLGYKLGPHDGLTLLEESIDKIVNNNPNLTIVKSAGNEGGNQCPCPHTSIITSKDTSIELSIIPISEEKPFNQDVIELWHTNFFDIQIERVSDGLLSPIIKSSKEEIITFQNGIDLDTIIVFNGTNKVQDGFNHESIPAGDISTLIFFSWNTGTLQAGNYKIHLISNSSSENYIDAYNFRKNNISSNGGFVDKGGDHEQSITLPGYAENVITVGAFTKDNTNNPSIFSSQGPYRISQDISKPDLCAPGSMNNEKPNGILSSSSSGDKSGIKLAGTSMAAPHVTGAIALILEYFDTLSNKQVKKLLQISADKVQNGESFEQKIKWGAGKLNVLAAYQQLVGYDGTDVEKPIVAFQETFEKFKDEAGLPIDVVKFLGDSNHRFQSLTNGALFQNGNTQEVFWLGQEIWNQWNCMRNVNSQIGLPITNQKTDGGILSDDFIVQFEQCSLIFDGSKDKVVVNENCTIKISGRCLENLTANLGNSSLQQNGERIEIKDLEIINTGSEKVQIKVPLHFYLSKDESADESDYFVHEKIISKLKAGEKENIDFNIDLSSMDVPPGEYFLGFKIDPKDELLESEEGDNQDNWNTPKIQIADESFSCNNAIPISCGEIYSGTTKGGRYGAEKYEGINWEETGPEKVHILQVDSPGDIVASITTLDEDNNVTNDHDLDVFILNGCDNNSDVVFDDKNAVLKNAAPGTYYIVVDGYNGDQGKYELLVTCGNDEPNLTIDNATSQIAVTQTTLAFSLNIKNTSCSVPAGANQVKIVLSPDLDFIDRLSPNEDKIIINQEISVLEPEGTFQIQEQFNLSDFNITPGLYYLGISIDYTKQISESEEGDNNFFWQNPEHRVVVVRGGAPNIELLITESQTKIEGSKVSYLGLLANIEDVSSNDFKMGFYLAKENPHLRGQHDDYFLGEAPIAGIGSNSTGSFNFLADATNPALGIPSGFYYLAWVVDYKDEVKETDEPGSWFWSTGKTENRVAVSQSSYCTGTTILTEDEGLFSDNSLDGNYENDTYCQWLIKPLKPAENIYLQFSNLSLGSGDKIEIFNGSTEESSLIKRLTTSSLPQEITGTNSSMLVRFSSNSNSPGDGFEASYSIDSKGFCNSRTVFTKPSGILSDGSGCENYNNNTDCTWLISPVEHDKNIFLEFSEFDLAEDDFVRIYNGDNIEETNLAATFTGVDRPAAFISASDKILVRFTANETNTRQGFEAVYNLLETEKDNSIPSLEDFNLGSSLNTESLSFNITFSRDEEYEVAITNILGQEFYRETFFGRGSIKTVDISTLENGHYFLYVYNKEGVNAKKFLVVK